MSGLPGPALLFCPADRPERYAKALDRADGVILDLEDAVAPADKQRAREALLATPVDPGRVIVRVNAIGTEDHERDLAMLARTGYRRLMLPKAVDARSLDRWQVIALVETAAGVLAAESLAAQQGVVGLMWGAEDLIASLGGSSSRHVDGRYRDAAVHARARVLLAAAARGIAAIDAVHLDIADVDGLAAEARDAAAQGFSASACIHPSQVAVIREAYRPSDEEVDAARALLAAAEGRPGVFAHEGRMVDEPVLRHARRIVARATP
ncbi:CoA ester lyase [Microcella daejeonensis]|uniref:CoA ester lyase n=1 Tax=Microcella daejeonensis TaxID=2994971 RepID=A0A9E8MJU9_9MICO|nr:CoA ester lyase [Microcella daejeonensis]WAB80876.1 CoA ester lyase [Microcella daejeonensis]